MASSSSQRMIHQDYIARIRYSNALPPPPNPPKLLDIPNTGLASGQYTTPGFASRLARDQPLNIEADAELGMPLDLVGMPGIFDGDESSIQAPLQIPPVHPHDRALLRPLSSLGKPKFSDAGVSFLRRTEYISSYTNKKNFDATPKAANDRSAIRARKPINLDRESPESIKQQVEKSFKDASQNLQKGVLMQHPSKKHLKLVDSFPLLPDHAAETDAGGYCSVKFLTNPVPPSSTYDIRLENSLLKPMEPIEEEEEAKRIARELHERDPEHNPMVPDSMDYEFFMTETASDARAFKRKFDPQDDEHSDEELYPQKNGSGEGCFRFKRIRPYESASFTGDTRSKYDDEVIFVAYDGKDGLHQKGVYYYPLIQKITIRPQRNKNILIKKNMFNATEDLINRQTDFVDLRVENPDEQTVKERLLFKKFPFGKPEEEDGGQVEEVERESDDE